MKKVLLATTALALSAGVAYAEVSLSGSARMGLVHTGKVAGSAAVAGGMTAGATGTIARYNTIVAPSALLDDTTAIESGAALQGHINALKAKINGTPAVYSNPTTLASAPVPGLKDALAAAQATRDTAIRNTGAPIANIAAANQAPTAGSDADVAAKAKAVADAEALLAAISGTAAVAETAATTRMEYRTRIVLTGSGETDSGLSYSASLRVADSTTKTSVDALSVNISGAFGSLTFGASSSAAEYAVGDIAGVGYTGVGFGNDTSFLSNGALAVYSYTAGGVTVYASAGQIDSDTFSIGASYSADGLSIGAGHESTKTAGVSVKTSSASASYAMGDTKVKVVYLDSDLVGKQTGVSVASTMGAVSVAAYYQSTDPVAVAAKSVNNYGVGASYDLGGGAAIKGGIAKLGKQTRADLGMTFSF
jgi:outer membrane protein OmpU